MLEQDIPVVFASAQASRVHIPLHDRSQVLKRAALRAMISLGIVGFGNNFFQEVFLLFFRPEWSTHLGRRLVAKLTSTVWIVL
jgi:hypothetical protein